MTRDERRAAQEQTIRDALQTQKHRLERLHAQRRVEARKERDKRRYRLGTLAEHAGLAGWDDGTLEKLFVLLGTLAGTPNPVAVLEGLLVDDGGPLPRVHGASAPSRSLPPSL